MLAVRSKVIHELLQSVHWSDMLDRAQTQEQVASVIEAFCIANGYIIRTLEPRRRPS